VDRVTRLMLCFLLCLLAAGCARGSTADQDRHDGFYGGVSGGTSP
jgi:hypothetical protein